MTKEEAIKVLQFNMEMCRFNPMTGDCIPMNKDCEDLANACEIAIALLNAIEPYEDGLHYGYRVKDLNSCRKFMQLIEWGNND